MLLNTCAVLHSSAATFAMCRVAHWQLLGVHQPDFQRPQNRIVAIASNSRHGWTQRLEITWYQVRYLRNRKIPFNNKINQTQMLTWALNNMYCVNILVVGFILIQVAQYSPPGQNGLYFADDIFKRILFNKNVWISVRTLHNFVPKGPIDNRAALVKVIATGHYLHQCWPG